MADFQVKVANLAKIQARIDRLLPSAQKAIQAELKNQVDDLVEADKRAMESVYDHQDNDHEKLIDSVRAYPNPDRVMSFRVIADARDKNGKFIGANVEQGHRAVDGTHVPGRPAFWPTYRAKKKPMQRAISKAGRDAIKAEWDS